jgi:hypothetical protein
MTHGRLVLSLLVAGFLLMAGDVMACEGCFAAGQTLPGGATTDHVTCWTYDDGAMESCYVEVGLHNCKVTNDFDTCPVQPPSGGGNNGGNSGGGSGGQCHRDASGACPPECTSCGSLINM